MYYDVIGIELNLLGRVCYQFSFCVLTVKKRNKNKNNKLIYRIISEPTNFAKVIKKKTKN